MVDELSETDPDFDSEIARLNTRLSVLEGQFYQFQDQIKTSFSSSIETTQKYSLWMYRIVLLLLVAVIGAIAFLIIKEIFPGIADLSTASPT